MKLLVLKNNLTVLINMCSLMERNEVGLLRVPIAKRSIEAVYNNILDVIIYLQTVLGMSTSGCFEMYSLNRKTAGLPDVLTVIVTYPLTGSNPKSSVNLEKIISSMVEKEIISNKEFFYTFSNN